MISSLDQRPLVDISAEIAPMSGASSQTPVRARAPGVFLMINSLETGGSERQFAASALVQRHSIPGFQCKQLDPANGPRVRIAEPVHLAALEEVRLPRTKVHGRLAFDQQVHRRVGCDEHVP